MVAIVDVIARLNDADLRAGLSRMGSMLESFGKAAAVSLAAVGAGFAVATAKAMDFEKAVAELQASFGSIEWTTARIRDLSQELSDLYGSGVTDNAKALTQVLQAGVTDAAQATELLHAASRLAIGGITDINTSIDTLTSTVNAYSAWGLKAAEATDAMFIAIRDGKTTAEELAAQMGNVAGIAAQAGVSFDEVAAAVATITTQGISTETAIINLRQILATIIKPSREAATEAQRLGVDFSVAALKAHGLNGVLADITSSAGFSDASLAKLFGNVRALSGAMSLTTNESKTFNQILDNMTQKAGATDNAFAVMSNTLAFQTDRFRSLGNAAITAFGEAVVSSERARDIIKGVNQVLVDLIGFLNADNGKKIIDDFFVALSEGLSMTARALIIFSEAYREFNRRVYDEVLVEALDENGRTAFDRRIAYLEGLEKRMRDISERIYENTVPPAIARIGGGSVEDQAREPRNVPRTGTPDIPTSGFAPQTRGDNIDINFLVNKTLADAGVPSPEVLAAAEQRAQEAAARISGSVFEPYRSAVEQAQIAMEQAAMARQQFLSNLVQTSMGLFSGLIAGATSAIVGALSSGTSVLDALGRLIGGTITQMGTLLIQLGTTATLAGLLSGIPLFAGIVGPPGVSTAAGLALIGGGIAMLGVGTAMGGAARGGGRSVPRSGGGGGGGGGSSPSIGPQSIPAGFSSGPAAIVNNYSYTFGASFVAGSPAEVGMQIQRYTREADRLSGRSPPR